MFKKDDKTKTDNYRPISLLSSISKLFEKVVHNQMFEYFTKNKLFYNRQYGFRTYHSTELAISELSDRVLYDIDNNKYQLPYTWIYPRRLIRWITKLLLQNYSTMESGERLLNVFLTICRIERNSSP